MNKEHPIIFSTDMVKAILEGRKTQTRRVIKLGKDGLYCCPAVKASLNPNTWEKEVIEAECPYGKVGDRLWVRETWCNINKPQYKPEIYYKADTLDAEDYDPTEWKWKPSIHLPYCWHRIDLEIIDIRVERLQEISEQGAFAEGCDYRDTGSLKFSGPIVVYKTNVVKFRNLWNSIHKKQYTWEDNPWVWVISFNHPNQKGKESGKTKKERV